MSKKYSTKLNPSAKSAAGFKSLGKKTVYHKKSSIGILETFKNSNPDSLYLVPLICNEFTAICPITGQPDFAKFEIVYVPRVDMVESKSLKLYMHSFRNEGIFHEDVTNRIFKDLWKLMDPKFMRIIGDFSVRGGIAIKPLVQKFASDSGSEHQAILEMLQSWDNAKRTN